MNNQQKFNKAIERKKAIETEIRKIVNEIVDTEGTTRDKLTKRHGELSAELDLLISEMAIYNQRIQEEKRAERIKMIEAKRAEFAQKQAEFTAEDQAIREAQKRWETLKNEQYNRSPTVEDAKRGAQIKHDLYLHEELKKLKYNEVIFIQDQLRGMGIR